MYGPCRSARVPHSRLDVPRECPSTQDRWAELGRRKSEGGSRGAAFQISTNGGVDTTLYKDGLISSDKIKLEVFELDAKGQPKQPALYSLDIDVAGLKTFKGTTKRAGGFPAGNYQVRITTDKFNEGDGKLRTAILVKDNFQLKNQEE